MTIINSNGGGGGTAINDIKFINTKDVVHIDQKDHVYLKEGYIETDLAKYPDATITTFAFGATGAVIDVSSQDQNPMDVTTDGTDFYIVGTSTASVYRYTSAGVYTGSSFSVNSQDGSPTGLYFDGLNFWMVGNNTDTIYQYNGAGVYTGVNFSVASEQASPQGITSDGSHFYVIGYNSPHVHKYTLAGAYTGESFTLPRANPAGITWTGRNFWVTFIDRYNYEFDENMVYTGTFFYGADTGQSGITYFNDNLWIVGTGLDEIAEYSVITGNGISDTTGDYEYYVRVK